MINNQPAAAQRVALKNGPAAALLVGYVQHHFYAPAVQISPHHYKNGAGCALYRQSGSDRLAGGPF
jgi:hypothetical protein